MGAATGQGHLLVGQPAPPAPLLRMVGVGSTRALCDFSVAYFLFSGGYWFDFWVPVFAVRGPLSVFGNLTAGCSLAGRGGSKGYDRYLLGFDFALARCGYRWIYISAFCAAWGLFRVFVRVGQFLNGFY